MMTRSDIMALIDADYIVRIRRQLHMYPELEFDLPRTLALATYQAAKFTRSCRFPFLSSAPNSSMITGTPLDTKR